MPGDTETFKDKISKPVWYQSIRKISERPHTSPKKQGVIKPWAKISENLVNQVTPRRKMRARP